MLEPKDFYKTLEKVLFRFYDKQLFEHGLAQTLNSLEKDKHCYTFAVEELPQKVGSLLDQYKTREYKEIVLFNNLQTICQELGGSELDNCMKIVHDVLIQKE